MSKLELLPYGQELWFVIVVQFDQLTSPVP